MIALLLCLSLGAADREVDLIELHHKYTEAGEHAYDQIILWQWSPDYRRYDAIGWRIVYHVEDYPAKTKGWWRTEIRSKKYRSRMYRETHSITDPETVSRKLNPNLKSILER